MIRALAAAVSALLGMTFLAAVPGTAAAAAPVHDVTVTGTGTGSYPAFSPSVDRYAVTTTGQTGGTVTVNATTSDPAGVVRVNGAPVTGPTTVSGLGTGDEVNVSISDGAGTSSQSWIYLPAGFPRLEVVADQPGQVPGQVFLTLASFGTTNTYETVVDRRGVPSFVSTGNGADFKVSGADPGQYSISRRKTDGAYEVVVLDDQYRPVGSRQLDQTPEHTDFHDVQLLPGGRTLMIGYDGQTHPGQADAVIQIVETDGHASFSWNSGDHADASEAYVDGGFGDYAHVNSVQLQPGGDILASFRNLSTVMRIATTNHDGYAPGDVVWRLGGARNDFSFADDPYAGPCAQHMARIQPDGHLMIFDNGSQSDLAGPLGAQTGDMCPDPSDPDGPRVARPVSRVTEYELDEQDHVATLVWSHEVPGRYAAFAGSQQRLDNGNTLVDWSRATESGGALAPIVTETTPTHDEIWGLRAAGWFSYRGFLYPAPDRIAPAITVAGVADGATYREGASVLARYSCTDRGGANLQTCSGSVGSGKRVSTTPGRHTLTLRATDGNGNATTRTVHYVVRARWRPDVMIRRTHGRFVGNNVYRQDSRETMRFLSRSGRAQKAGVRFQNDGASTDTFRIVGSRGTRKFPVRYYRGSVDVTARVVTGRLAAQLRPGHSYDLLVTMSRRGAYRAGRTHTVFLRAVSRGNARRTDRVLAVRG